MQYITMLALMNKGKTKENPYFLDAKQLLQFYNMVAIGGHYTGYVGVSVCMQHAHTTCDGVIYYYKHSNIIYGPQNRILGGATRKNYGEELNYPHLSNTPRLETPCKSYTTSITIYNMYACDVY